MKQLILLCDGIADYQTEALNNRTPSETAAPSCINYLAARSLVGIALLPTVPTVETIDSEEVFEAEGTDSLIDPVFTAEEDETIPSEPTTDSDELALPTPTAFADPVETLGIDKSIELIELDLTSDPEAVIQAFRNGEKKLFLHVSMPTENADALSSIEQLDNRILRPIYHYLLCAKDDFKILFLTQHPTREQSDLSFFLYSSRDEVEGPAVFNKDSLDQQGLQLPDTRSLFKLLDSTETQKSIAQSNGVTLKNRFSTSFLLDWIELVGIALVTVILLMTICFRHSPVVGSSMYPTLIGSPTGGSETIYTKTKGYDVLLISDLFYTPANGDIVIIQTANKPDQPLVKRIIATEGQKIKIDFTNWKIWIDGKLLEENYINRLPNVEMSAFDIERATGTPLTDGIWEGTVPQGCIFVLGDNRNNSSDSRSLGYIDTRLIVGRVVIRLSPLDRFGIVD